MTGLLPYLGIAFLGVPAVAGIVFAIVMIIIKAVKK